MTTKITEQNISELANAGVNWQSVFTGDGSTGLTAVAGRGYFIDTTSGTVTVTLPASPSVGDVVVLKDYARTWGTNNITIASTLFDGSTNASTFSTNGQTVTLVYMDGTKGWSLINEDTTTGLGAQFISATGGTVTTSGDYKIHTFTGDGCFVVSCAGNPVGSTSIDYLVVAGGGGGATGPTSGKGGGGGGFRLSNSTCMPAPLTSPLATPTGTTATVQPYPITVGGGGAVDTSGSNSVFSAITSAGGGQGGASGGSGGGDACGNTPPVSPPQGNDGGVGQHAGGGGAGEAGGAFIPPNSGGTGGNGSFVSPTMAGCNGTPGPVGSTRYFAGGGAGGYPVGRPSGIAGGAGGGGYGGEGAVPAGPGATNTGGGGGGSANSVPGAGTGGSGIVIIRYKFQ